MADFARQVVRLFCRHQPPRQLYNRALSTIFLSTAPAAYLQQNLFEELWFSNNAGAAQRSRPLPLVAQILHDPPLVKTIAYEHGNSLPKSTCGIASGRS
jgi:hypothetical protein